MKLSLALPLLFTALPFCAAYLEDPPTTADPSTISDCSWWIVASTGNTCAAIASDWSISVNDFSLVYNPVVGSSCALLVGNSYCVERNYGLPVSTSTTSTTSATTTAGNGITTPTPTQTGMVSSCNKFYFVQANDGCAVIASNNGVALSDFYAWNPAVKTDCSGLWASVYVCVGIVGSTSTGTITSTSTTTTSGNGVATPTPTQTGMISSCNKFYFVQSGDGCANIASTYGISLADFYSWNPAAGTDCAGLWVSVYVCVGIIGQTSTSTTTTITSTTTSAGNGISTPTPTQTGMISSCNKFYFVQSGDGCAAIATTNGISLSNFYTWNPAVKTDCSALWVSVYVCVGIIGSTPTTTLITTTTTKSSNGITTPTPTQSGMVGNCDAFHLVVSGDTCYDIASAVGVTLTQFYTWNPSVGSNCEYLQLGVYVCTSLI